MTYDQYLLFLDMEEIANLINAETTLIQLPKFYAYFNISAQTTTERLQILDKSYEDILSPKQFNFLKTGQH